MDKYRTDRYASGISQHNVFKLYEYKNNTKGNISYPTSMVVDELFVTSTIRIESDYKKIGASIAEDRLKFEILVK